jgi:hypothetical protein
MRFIQKNNEPQSLIAYKRIEGESARFDGLTRQGGENGIGSKTDIQLSLLEEQGHICAYCMKRINQNKMKIEHWFSQEKVFTEGQNERKEATLIREETLNHERRIGYGTNLNPETYLDLDYGNMLGVCEGKIVNDLHCDSSRGSRSKKLLFIRPTNERTINHLHYKANGEIYSKNEDIFDDINNEKVLNLNHYLLVRNRAEALKSVLTEIERMFPNRTAPPNFIQNQYDKWNSRSKTITYQDVNGNSVNSSAYFEYCQIVVYFLKKRLGRR